MAVKDEVIKALRLSAAAATSLSDEIDRNIRTARAEMIRVGISEEAVNADIDLVSDGIVTYCEMKMGAPDRYEQYREAWLYQIECMRKSTLRIPEPAPIQPTEDDDE